MRSNEIMDDLIVIYEWAPLAVGDRFDMFAPARLVHFHHKFGPLHGHKINVKFQLR